MSKTSLKKQLLMLDRDQIMEVLLELYDARKDAREYLEYYVDPDENKMFDKYKAVILKEFSSQKGRAKARTSVCKKAIKEFTTLHPSPRLIADLKLTLAESIMRYAVTMRSWVRASHEGTFDTVFSEVLDYMYAHDILDSFDRRVKGIIDLSGKLRGTLHTLPRDIYDDFLRKLAEKPRNVINVNGLS